MNDNPGARRRPSFSLTGAIAGFFLRNKLIVVLGVLAVVGWGLAVAPFDWDTGRLPRDPVPVDAIPDIGENQQIVFTIWAGRSPQDVEDQVSYPLTAALLGVPGVRTVRSFSMLGFSTIYIIFEDGVDFYWSRSRVLERLSSLPAGALPEGAEPVLGPDATALGQVFWYTLEGRDDEGRPAGGWDLEELRGIQDWTVRYALLSAGGVSEVASVGGFVREYQVDVDPDAMRAFGVTLDDVYGAVRMANLDVGARTIEVNRVEYVIRGVGFIKSVADIENTVITARGDVPVYVRNVANVSQGPASRRGALDKGGAEAVGGVVVVRYGANPLETIKNVKRKIEEISRGLPARTLEDGTVSRVTIVPFYDRTGLIRETLGTLNSALTQEILVTVIVVLVMLMHFRSSVLISGLLPLAVLTCFIAMKIFGIDANIVALSGIAIAIGTMVDMGIVVTENILRHLKEAGPGEDGLEVVLAATREVGSAVVTAVSTTVVSFLPVFTMVAAEGKLFKPLAWTKTFALVSSVVVAIVVIPPMAHALFVPRGRRGRREPGGDAGGDVGSDAGHGAGGDDGDTGPGEGDDARRGTEGDTGPPSGGGAGPHSGRNADAAAGGEAAGRGGHHAAGEAGPRSGRGPGWRPGRLWERIPAPAAHWARRGASILAAVGVTVLLAGHWTPLGPGKGLGLNFTFAALLLGGLLGFVYLVQRFYAQVLCWCLGHRRLFLSVPAAVTLLGALTWLGYGTVFGWLPQAVRTSWPASAVAEAFPGLGKEFMPPLDEGSYLLMPTTMPHASIGEVMDVLRKQDMAISRIPEVESAVGKLGRADTPLDPAPISMIETVINYYPEFLEDRDGRRLTFRFDPGRDDYFRNAGGEPVPAPDGEPYVVRGTFERDSAGRLIPEPGGRPFRLWRPPLEPGLNPGREAWRGILEPDHIWEEILMAAEIPGTTPAPRLQPIAARIVMLQSGMRAPMGVKIKGPDLDVIESVGIAVEGLLKEVPSVDASTVIADRIVGKPYLEITPDRNAIARYGVHLARVQEVIEMALGGKRVTTTVEGRERYPVRVRYMRELRDRIESLGRVLVPAAGGAQVPLEQLASIDYVRGPQMIKSEDTFLVGYVLFDKKPGYAEVDVVEHADAYLRDRIESGELEIPPGVSLAFAGNYENQQRAQRTLSWVLPLALLTIFLILYLQFRSAVQTGLVFSGVLVAWAGGFLMIWLYGRSWFLDFPVFGVSMRELFQVHPLNLSVAVWVGFLALFGIATDDGVIMTTYLNQRFAAGAPRTVAEIRRATVEAGLRRVRPCLMTTATTVLALIPVLTSTGRGSDVMVPMAIPSFGGMVIVSVSMFVVPVLYSAVKEMELKRRPGRGAAA